MTATAAPIRLDYSCNGELHKTVVSTSIEALFTPTSASIKPRETWGERYNQIMMVCSAHDCLNFRTGRNRR